MALEGVDMNSVWSAGGLATVLAAIAIPLWRKFSAQMNTATDAAHGEASWIKRQAIELESHKIINAELMQLRLVDAELISSLKLKEALQTERMERQIERMERMEVCLRRMHEVLVTLEPKYAHWLDADISDTLYLTRQGDPKP